MTGDSDAFRRKGNFIRLVGGAGSPGDSWTCECVVCETDSHKDSLSCSDTVLALDSPCFDGDATWFADFLSFFEWKRPKSGIGRPE